jgi:hypothetical protein
LGHQKGQGFEYHIIAVILAFLILVRAQRQELLEKLLQSQPDGNPNALSHALMEGQLAYALMEQHKDEQAEALFQSAVSTVAASPANESLGYALICLRYAKLKARHKDWRNPSVTSIRGSRSRML